jgi:hypothetical protein
LVRRFAADEGRSIWVWRDALPKDEVAALLADPGWPPRKNSAVTDSPDLVGYTRTDIDAANRIGATLLQYMPWPAPPFEETPPPRVRGFCSIVTFGRSVEPISWHRDHNHGAKYKLFVYLNAPSDRTSGGTIFGKRAQHHVHASPGTVVLFDIELVHRGEDQPSDFEKLTIGLRPIT